MRISKSNHLKRLLLTQDALIGMLSYVVSVDIYWLLGWVDAEQLVSRLLVTPLVFVVCIGAFKNNAIQMRPEGARKLLLSSGKYTGLLVGFVMFAFYFSQTGPENQGLIVLFAFLLFSGLVSNRLLLQWWYFQGRQERPENYLKILVVGAGRRAQELMHKYEKESDWGVSIIGILDPDPMTWGTDVDNRKVLGGINEISNILADTVIDEVIICLPRSLMGEAGDLIQVCDQEGICIKFLADLVDMPKGTLSYENLGDSPMLSFEPVAQDEWNLVVKRIVDLLITIPLLIMLSPIYAVVAVMIKMTSPGPVLFAQTRIGLNKREFRMLKFRSMFVGAEDQLCEIEHLNEANGPIFKIERDPRVTKVGRIIRKLSLDEMPQLINVLMGQMSLVGPRPMSKRDVQLFDKSIQRRRFSVRPGLACLREVSGRSALSFEKWLELDLKYIDEWSLWLDVKILLKIVPSVIKGEGAS